MILYPPKVSSEHLEDDVGTSVNHHRNDPKVTILTKSTAFSFKCFIIILIFRAKVSYYSPSRRTTGPKPSDSKSEHVGRNAICREANTKNRGSRKCPSHGPVIPFNPLCTGRLKDGRENKCPSRYPPFLGPIHSIRKVMWVCQVENGSETGVRTDIPHVPSALCTSAFEEGGGSMWG